MISRDVELRIEDEKRRLPVFLKALKYTKFENFFHFQLDEAPMFLEEGLLYFSRVSYSYRNSVLSFIFRMRVYDLRTLPPPHGNRICCPVMCLKRTVMQPY